MYLREFYKDELLFADSKIVTSVYDQGFEGELSQNALGKITFDGIPEDQISELKSPDYNNLLKVAVR